jgi:hypothetical protein
MKKIMRFLMMAFLLASMGLAAESDMTVEAKNGFHPETAEPANTNSKQRSAIVWQTTWSDEFNGSGSIDASRWICDTGTSYPGGPANWGTGEVEIYTCDTSNIFESGGYLNIRALHSGTDPQTNWTSARIETVSADFQPPVGGSMAVEARIQLPNVNSTNGLGYWPAFWMLGAPYRGNYQNWPGIGEIDVMENANGLNRWIGALHCGTNPNGPCNEPSGIGSYLTDFDPSLQSAFHTFRVEIDRSVAPEQIRWYVDGINTFTVNANQMDETTWTNAIDHGFFILLNVAMGGGLPNALAGNTTPTSDTVSNGTMLVDYVHVEYSMQPPNSIAPGSIYPGTADHVYTRRPAFHWDPVPAAVSYTVEIAPTSYCDTFSTIELVATIKTNSYTPVQDLLAQTVYCWRVKANGLTNSSDYSQVRIFKTGNPPSVPTLSAPANQALVTSRRPLFDWNNSSLPAQTLFNHYEIQVDRSSLFTTATSHYTPAGDITASSWKPPLNLNSATTYYWRVRSWNAAGDFSGWSTVRKVRIAYSPPTLSTPGKGSNVASRKPPFIWATVSGATSYRIQVSTSSTFGTLLVNATTTEALYTPTTQLPMQTKLYWRMQSLGSYGPSLWSKVFYFTIIPPLHIYYGTSLRPGLDMGVDSSSHQTGWVKNMNGYMKASYPKGQTWGVVFITVGKPAPIILRNSMDLSQYKTLSVEMYGETGNERVYIGMKDATQPDDGREIKILQRLSSQWQTYTFALQDFIGVDLSKVYIPVEFVFQNNIGPETIYFRNIQFLP